MKISACTPIAVGLLIAASTAAAQPPPPGPPRGDGDDPVARMLAFDADGDGALTVDEVADPRLHRLLARADGDGDGSVSPEELAALFAREAPSARGFGPGPGPGPSGPFRPGQILPDPVRRDLELTDEQEKQLAELQEEVDARSSAILTPEQRDRLRSMQRRGPGGPFVPRPAPPPPPEGPR